MKIMVLGGDGFCGWPTSLYLSSLGHDVCIVDNLSRRAIDVELGTTSLTPIATVPERIAAWRDASGSELQYRSLDLSADYDEFLSLLTSYGPDSIVHFAEQRAAPYSMKSSNHKRYTVNNNVNGTHNVLCAIVESGLDIHVVHLGTMGVYGYGTAGISIPEGYVDVEMITDEGRAAATSVLYPTNPGSIYHMTKSVDQLLFAYYAKNDGLRVTDLHQGIVWGTNTEQTLGDPRLVNRFDYCGDYGTVLNRFLVQAAIGYPLTVHGTGGQTRAFIHISDTVCCVGLAVHNPPTRGDRVKILNQMTETHRVGDLATLVGDLTGAEVAFVPNPRNESPENELAVRNEGLTGLGLEPTTLSSGLLTEVYDVAERFMDRVDRSRIPCYSTWTDNQQPGIPAGIEIPQP